MFNVYLNSGTVLKPLIYINNISIVEGIYEKNGVNPGQIATKGFMTDSVRNMCVL